jgi:hypothetical protein
MQKIPQDSSTKGPAEMFIGDVYFDVIAKGEDPSRMRVNIVAAKSSSCGQATRCTRRPVNGIGTVRLPRTS